MTRPLVVVASLLCLSAGSLAAQAPSAPVARAVRISAPPVIDGRLDDSAWQGVAPATGFVQHEPFEGRPATERTEVRILYDDEALYVGAWLLDRSPGQIVVGEVRRDVDLANLDAFIMVLDTYRDRQNAFVFGTSPAGVEYDGQVTREGEGGSGQGTTRQTGGSGGGLNLNWDGSWTVRTSRDSAGWYAEFRIPFATLRYRRGEGQVWGLNFTRNIQRVNERSTWTPLPREFSVYRISAFGALEGLEPPAGRVATATPYVLGSVRRDYARPDTDTGLDIGGDVKLGLSSSMTLDLTANTDFAQVEVDEQQLNLTRFNLFFPEKRPFFLENAGTFSVGTAQSTELFFSRRIGIGADRREVPLLGGGRLSGNIGGLTIGVLDIQADSREGVPANNFAAVRVVQQLPSRSRLGAIAVSRLNTDSTADYNLTFGLDGRMGIGRYLLLDGYAAQTETP
ncbi:MAG: carbohydrate binding family 9 domain-containing protein, partial [Gemmatimonadales bacterium]|nr:carbohydrate binding family 9 domain-containing protein [Gemmatimonadales bacterium]